MADLAEHWAYLKAEWRAAQAAPLSIRKTLLVAALIDAYADRLFVASAEADDILAFRSTLATGSPALALVFELCAQRQGGPRLVVETVAVPLERYGSLGVEDFMVSLYNDHTVQRVMIAMSDGARRLAHEVLAEALEALGGR